MKYFIFALLLTGCCTDQRPNESTDHYRIRHRTDYVQDERTGLCYAVYNLGGENGTMANVPCTDEVKKLLIP